MPKLSVYLSEASSKQQALCSYLSHAIETVETVKAFVDELEGEDDFQICTYIRISDYYREKCREVIAELQQI